MTTDADLHRRQQNDARAADRADACRASVESHGDDVILVGAVCQVCGSPGEWGLYWSARTGWTHCRECGAWQDYPHCKRGCGRAVAQRGQVCPACGSRLRIENEIRHKEKP